MTPLYQLTQNQAEQTTWEELINSKTAHPGLTFDKFPNGWKRTQNGIKLPDGEGGAKDTLYQETAERTQEHLADGLKQYIKRQKKLIDKLSGTKLELQTDWRLITGLGNSHPYETGFTWHRTLGVPYLSGSSIKGILRDWISKWVFENPQEGQQEADRLLGTSDTEEENTDKVGSMIIFDALPVTPPKLEVDIMNPHYQLYYTNPENPPADYYNPIPIKFLTLSEGQEFLFSIAPRRPHTKTTIKDVNQCVNYLIDALNTIGAGGKTAVGYGIFSESLEVTRKREAKEEESQKQIEKETQKVAAEKAAKESGLPETLTPMITQLKQENWEKDNAKFYAGIEQWLPIIQKEEKEIQQKVAHQLADIIENLSPKNKGIMNNPDKTQGKKQNSIYKPQAVKIAKQLLALKNKE